MTWDGSSLPETQAELYERYLRKIYEWNQNLHELAKYAERCGTTTTELKQDSHQQSDILKKLKQNLNRKLGELAKAALNLPQERFRLSQALVEQHLGEESDRTSLGYLALRLGWLNRVGKDGRGDGIFAFYHATFQEYFAALAVEDWDYFLPKDHVDCPVAGKRYRIFEKQWKQVILCWLGRGDIEAEKKEGFIRALVEFNDGVQDFYGYQAYFLAATGINEFTNCYYSNFVVQKITAFAFGLYSESENLWMNFEKSIRNNARKAAIETNRKILKKQVLLIIDSPKSPDYIKLDIIELIHRFNLFKIDDIQCVDYLLNILIDNHETMSNRIYEIFSEWLWKDEDFVVNYLIEKMKNINIFPYVFDVLEKLAHKNFKIIETWISWTLMANDYHIFNLFRNSLCKISKGNIKAINHLLHTFEIAQNGHIDSTCFLIATILGEIAEGNPECIKILIHFLASTNNKKKYDFVFNALSKIGKNDPQAINALTKILYLTEKSTVCRTVAKNLRQLEVNNLQVINFAWIRALELTNDEEICWDAAVGLMQTGQHDEKAMDALVRAMENTKTKNTYIQILISIGKITNKHNSKIIFKLQKLLESCDDKEIRLNLAITLLSIDPENLFGISEMINNNCNCIDIYNLVMFAMMQNYENNENARISLCRILSKTHNISIRQYINSYFKIFLKNHQHKISALLNLRSIMTNETEHEQLDLLYNCYEVFWGISQDIPYPEFYQAWHNPPTTPHPEVEDNTPATPTPFTQQCNLALLPQILNQAIQTHPVNRQPICIDGSRFSDPSNPALQIYTTLKKAGCPPSPDGKPRTIAELQAYCEDDLSDQAIALILYEEPTDPPPQGLDIAVLNQLARLSHPPIAVVVPQPLPECRLPQFLESDPDLMATLLQWLQNLDR
ncbi:PBS lyase [Roseofilum sp. BLCC_M91]|uniref:PBS lyase n=1 Tax=Roseofilum halophilum BLCC-M91 TaxID=3022259 RepID=A0ABT7BME7_9CYAN|nr:hypothetical protein [Roseofilum halophilum]MDJ1180341.1 PBS lyase [Roseofilum halophilum BLCC-M91]